MKIAIVGFGSIGKRHVQNLLSISNAQIIICTEQVVNHFPKRVKIVRTISDCLKENPDAVIIANVSSLHVPIATKFAKSGIDLFVEKPLSNSLRGIKNLTVLIKEKKLITQIGCQFRFHKCINEIKELISSKRIGKIISVRVECGSFLPDWHPYEDYAKSYAARDDLGGGVVLTNIHEIDYLYWFFGEISELFSLTGKYSHLKLSADDLSVATIRFKNGIIAELHLDYFQKPDYRSCKIIGTKGMIYWDSDANKVLLYDNIKNKWIKVLEWSNYDRNFMFKAELVHFLDCIKRRRLTINPLERDGIRTLKIGLAIMKSSKMKRVIKP